MMPDYRNNQFQAINYEAEDGGIDGPLLDNFPDA